MQFAGIEFSAAKERISGVTPRFSLLYLLLGMMADSKAAEGLCLVR